MRSVLDQTARPQFRDVIVRRQGSPSRCTPDSIESKAAAYQMSVASLVLAAVASAEPAAALAQPAARHDVAGAHRQLYHDGCAATTTFSSAYYCQQTQPSPHHLAPQDHDAHPPAARLYLVLYLVARLHARGRLHGTHQQPQLPPPKEGIESPSPMIRAPPSRHCPPAIPRPPRAAHRVQRDSDPVQPRRTGRAMLPCDL